jgi:MFS family permease
MNPLERKSLLGLASLYAFRMIGLFMLLPVLSLYSNQYSGSSTILVGVALGIYGLTQGLFQIPLGFLSDRFGRKPIIFIGMIIFFFGSILAAMSDSMWGLIAGRALQGVGAVASTIMALLSDLTTEQSRTKAMAFIGASIGVSFAISLVAGPILADLWGLAGLFWLTGVLSLLGISILLFIVPSPTVMKKNAESQPVPEMFNRLLKNQELLRLNYGIAVLHFAQMAIWISVPLILEQAFSFSREDHWIIYLAILGLSFVCMLPFILLAEAKQKIKLVLVSAILLLALGEFILGASLDNYINFLLGLFIFFMAFNLLEAILPSLVSKLAPPGSKGTAIGIYSSSQFLGAFLGGISGGIVVHNFGYSAIFLLAGFFTIIWVYLAATMMKPLHLKTLTVQLTSKDVIEVEDYISTVPGVCDVVVIAEEKIAYFKIDMDRFCPESMEKKIGRKTYF